MASCRRCYQSNSRWKRGQSACLLSFSTAVSIFGGFAPFVATWLIAQTGSPLSPSYYLIFTALLSLAALIAIQRRSRRLTAAVCGPLGSVGPFWVATGTIVLDAIVMLENKPQRLSLSLKPA